MPFTPFAKEMAGRKPRFWLSWRIEQNIPLDLEMLEAKPFLSAMVSSFKGNELPLARQISRLTTRR